MPLKLLAISAMAPHMKAVQITKAILYSMKSQSLTDTEKTAPKVSEKLAKIVNLRWLNKLDETNLKGKVG